MSALLYPSEPPIASVTNIVDIVQDGNIRDRRDEFAKSAWICVGYLLRVSLGDPQVAGGTRIPDAVQALIPNVKDDKQCASVLLKCFSVADAPNVGTFDWRVFISPQLIRWLLDKLADLLVDVVQPAPSV